MAEQSAERGPPLVEVVVKDPRGGRPSATSALRSVALVGVLGGAVLVALVTLASGQFLPWYLSSNDITNAGCKPQIVEAHINAALSDGLQALMLTQGGAFAAGFLVLATLSALRRRKRAA